MKTSSLLRRVLRRLQFWSFRPRIPRRVDHNELLKQAADFFGESLPEVNSHFETYRAFYEATGYEQSLGERKTLCFEEAFLIYLSALHVRPANVVEIGTQYGKSTRRIVDLLRLLELDSRVTCFDIADQLRFVSRNEVRLVVEDVTGRFSATVLDGIDPGLIYLDAHPYSLLEEVISGFIEWSRTRRAILAVHDCGNGLYNRRMRISKADPGVVRSTTGVWERHVLSDVFGVPNRDLDDLQTLSHRLRVFGTPHGLALIAPLEHL